MPTLLEVERAVCRSLVEGDDAAIAQYVVADGLGPEVRLNVYRNTFIGTLTTALGLSFPVVRNLVGAAFFESVGRIFIESAPPHSAWLDAYGEDFPAFLASFGPAASLPYLPGVARLEWAVSWALHASDVEALDISNLAAIDSKHHKRIVFLSDPSLGLVRADHPVDEIWRSVLAQNDDAMAAIDLDAGPVGLLVQRLGAAVEVIRLSEPEWYFMSTLCAGRPLGEALDRCSDIDPASVLANHFSAGRFIGFTLADEDGSVEQQELSV